jgi:ribosome-associated protein
VAADAAAAKLGTDVVMLDVAEIMGIVDCFVLVSASNTRQVRTIVDEVEHALRRFDDSKPIGTEGLDDAHWVLIDYGDVAVHVFLQETRAYYDLDRLFADAPRMNASDAPVASDQGGSR